MGGGEGGGRMREWMRVRMTLREGRLKDKGMRMWMRGGESVDEG
jgi:hypothetical protein